MSEFKSLNGYMCKDEYARNTLAPLPAKVSSLTSRMDNMTALGEGSTTGDAELLDARVSDVGVSHTNVGKLLRTNLAILRLQSAADCVKEMDLYGKFKKAYVDGTTNNTDDCITIWPPVQFSRHTTIKPLPGYEVSCQEYTKANGDGWSAYLGWTNESHLLQKDHYYSICLRHTGGHITLDEGSALIFEEPFYYGENYGNALDTILPLMVHGGFTLDSDDCYWETDKTAMYTKGGIILTEPAVLHCSGESFITFHYYDNETISPSTFKGDNGWSKEVYIPANTFGVVYFKASEDRRMVELNDLKTIHYGHSIDVATDKGNINRMYVTPDRKAIAHRGYTNYGEFAPENTLPAFRLAKAQGFDYVECDVRISSDGVPVICHDLTVDRTSDGTGYVQQMTVAQLKALDFSVACNVEKYAGTKMPTLEETLITAKNIGLNLYLEIEPECQYHEASIVSLVKAYSMENAVTYLSFSWDVLFNIIKLDDSASVALLMDGATTATVEAVKGLRTGYNDAFLSAGNGTVSSEVLTKAMADGVPVEIWVINDPEIMRNLNPYVRGVTSEYTNYKTVLHDMEMEGY